MVFMAEAVSIGGKVVVITGGARGIGFATAKALREAGANVAIGDIDESAVKEAGTNLGLGVYATLDVTDFESFSSFLDEVERRLGPIDVLVNNAGISPAGRFVDEPEDVTKRIIAINVYGVLLGSKLAAQRMLKRGNGHIINIASLSANMPVPGLATYSATKHAVAGFTDTARVEYHGTGVSFSAVLPTLTNTDMVAGVPAARGLRNAEPQDVAAAIVRLIEKPRPRVAVTRLAGVMDDVTRRFLPVSVADRARRALGIYDFFADNMDVAKRRAYEERARTT
jgi:NAD(P)-dependent dehydrogenase (short-subunit alcohol dehydrogenase family)